MARKKRPENSAPGPDLPAKGTSDENAQQVLTLDPAQFQLGYLVSERLKLDDIAVIALSVKRDDDVGISVLRIHMTSKSNAYFTNEEQNKLVVRPTLSLCAFRRSGDQIDEVPAISIDATFAIIYTCENVAQMPSENLEAFANSNAIFNLWPFWRELVMSISNRMRIAPIVVPFIRL